MADTPEQLIVSLSADVNKLNKNLQKALGDTDKFTKQNEAKHKSSLSKIEQMWGTFDPGEAFEKTFSRARFGLLEEGGARIGVFGSALEALGPAGLAAAAGLFVAFEGMEQVRKAAEEVGDLKITSDKLGIPVEDLQRWQFIAAQSHVSNEQLGTSFEGLSVTLGKLKSGIRDQRIRPFLDELGINDADIAKAHNAADLLDLLIDKMSKISDPSERVQIADAFGMESALPLLSRTRAEIQGMSDDFRQNAHVISGEQAEAVERSNQALERAHALMHDDIRDDLIRLAPLVSQLGVAWDGVAAAALGAAADMLSASNIKPKPPGQALAGAAADAVGGPGGLGGLLKAGLSFAMDAQKRVALEGMRIVAPPVAPPERKAVGEVGSGERTRGATERAAKATDDLNKALDEYVTHTSHAAEMQKRIANDRQNGAQISSKQEADLMAAARAQDAKFGAAAGKKADEAAKKALDETRASDDALSTARKDELKARIALTADMLADHQLRLQELADDRDRKNRQAQQDVQAGKISASAGAQVVSANNGAYGAGVDLENRRFSQDVADQARTYSGELARFQAQHLTAQAEIATTAEAWAAETKQAFALQQQADRAEFIDKTNKRLTEMGANHLSSTAAAAQIAAYDAQQADEMAKNTRDTDLEVLSRKREFADQLQGYVSSTLEAEASIATTAAQRRALEQRILDIRQQQARDELEQQVRAPGYTGDAGAARAGLAAQQSAEQSQFDQQHAGPLAAWVASAQKASGDVNTALQTEAVKGIDEFNSALANSIVNAKNFGDAFKSILRSIMGDLIQLVLKQGEVGIFGALGAASPSPSTGSMSTAALSMLLPHFAGGTDNAPGGEALVGENGPEEVELPQGSKVIPNSALRQAQNISTASIRAPEVRMNHNVTIDLTGANGDATIARVAHAAATAAYAQAISTSRADLRRSQQSANRSLI